MADLAANEAGTATIADGGSGRQEWQMRVTQQRWGTIAVSFQSKAAVKDPCTTITVAENGSVSSADCKGKPKAASPQLTRAAVLFARYQVHAQLARLLTRRVV